MLDKNQILNISTGIIGMFEGGSWNNITGDFDKMGFSAGLCQWNIGMGSLQILLKDYEKRYGWDTCEALFRSHNLSNPLKSLMNMPVPEALSWVRSNMVNPKSKYRNLLPAWKDVLGSFMSTKEMVDVQRESLANTYLAKASKMLNTYVPPEFQTYRSMAFFLDVAVQNGGMKNVSPIEYGSADPIEALVFSQTINSDLASRWRNVIETDMMARHLFYLAHKRATLSRPEYTWDVFSRKATLACKIGIVHKSNVDLTTIIPD